ncbi:hypothetical protein PIB30_064147 [Stylosanthes scabra]|uniref:Uncharacterized protein n=1 Tax=Stylosanthes scabra TaxID=79078 RepID=A0ABU6SLM3_9FABA|nr:hypothetical protein [Stylosanthes scabra]
MAMRRCALPLYLGIRSLLVVYISRNMAFASNSSPCFLPSSLRINFVSQIWVTVPSSTVVASRCTFTLKLPTNAMFEKAVKLYAKLAEVAVNSFLISKDSPITIEPIRLHNGAEENNEALRKSKGD